MIQVSLSFFVVVWSILGSYCQYNKVIDSKESSTRTQRINSSRFHYDISLKKYYQEKNEIIIAYRHYGISSSPESDSIIQLLNQDPKNAYRILKIHMLRTNIVKRNAYRFLYYTTQNALSNLSLIDSIVDEFQNDISAIPNSYTLLRWQLLNAISIQHYREQDYDSAAMVTIDAIKSLGNRFSEYIIQFTASIGNLFLFQNKMNNNDYKQYLSLYLEAVRRADSLELITTFNFYNQLLLVAEKTGNMDEVNRCRESIKYLFTQVLNPDDPKLQEQYYRSCMIMLESGDYETALDYINQAIRIGELQGADSKVSIEDMLFYKAEILEMAGEMDSARSCFEAVMKDYDSYEPDDQCFFACNYSVFLQKNKEFTKARKIIDRALRIAYREMGALDIHTGLLLQVSSENNLHVSDTARAIAELWKAMDAYEANYSGEHYDIGIIHQALAEIYRDAEMLDSSLFHSQQAIINCSIGFKENNFVANPWLSQILLLEHSILSLELKSDILIRKYRLSGEAKYLENSLQTNFLLIDLVDTMQQLLPLMEAKLGFSDRFGKAYKAGMICAVELYQHHGYRNMLDTAWLISELAKANLLRQTLNEIGINKTKHIHSSTSANLNSLLQKISHTKQELFELRRKGQPHPSEIAEVEGSLFRQKRAYFSAIEQARNTNPEYFRLISSRKPLGLVDAMRSLKAGKTQISFFDADSLLYCFGMNRERIRLNVLRTDSAFLVKVSEFRRIMDSGEYRTNLKRSQSRFIQLAGELHSSLISPFENIIAKRDLIIIPDGILSHLPFGLLIAPDAAADLPAGVEQMRSLPYLFRNHNISYANSSSLLEVQRSTPSNGPNRVLTIAPNYSMQDDEHEGLSQLDGSSRESRWVNDVFPGSILAGQEANKEALIRKLPGHSILHLATHSTLDDDSPLHNRIELSCSGLTNACDLYVHELFSLRIDADLAVLSGCQTAVGTYHKGEGMISLASAFLMAGCNSTAVSLWEVPDEGGADLMSLFFSRLKDGHTKDEALRMAQIEFLEQADESKLFPAYWGMFVVIGDNSPISETARAEMMRYASIIMLILSGIAFTFKAILVPGILA
jgi:CHAT domain-containing protein